MTWWQRGDGIAWSEALKQSWAILPPYLTLTQSFKMYIFVRDPPYSHLFWDANASQWRCTSLNSAVHCHESSNLKLFFQRHVTIIKHSFFCWFSWKLRVMQESGPWSQIYSASETQAYPMDWKLSKDCTLCGPRRLKTLNFSFKLWKTGFRFELLAKWHLSNPFY